MTYAANYRDFGSCFRDKASARAVPTRPSPAYCGASLALFLRRVRSRSTERSPLFVARSGGRITDDIERKIMQHFFASNWNARQ